MNEEKKIKSSEYIVSDSIQETMIGPLWSRATLSKKYPDLLRDPKANEILNQIEHDFTKLKDFLGDWRGIGLFARAHNLDYAVINYINAHPNATIVNIGAGLDTTFHRVDNGKIMWYDLDLPNAIEFRVRFIPETPRNKVISSSAFDLEWMESIDFDSDKGIFFIAGGFIYYFSENKIASFFKALAERFPGGGIVFDCVNKFAVKVANKRAKKYNSELSFKLAIGNPTRIISWSKKNYKYMIGIPCTRDYL
jgi:O-methyltransferase involved in polyketide biosynthesis